ncbi:MAG: ATP synthase F1 subunit epsilon [Lachnospiraceae bacterium]|nr:ATP synthase F1 subunit epsilon [Lachnospiraceae bacterium]
MADNLFKIKIVSPERIFFTGNASLVEFNTSEGEIGIYKGHIPLTVIIAPGILTLHLTDEKKVAALHSGFAEILPDSITILAEIVEWPEEIDLSRAEAAKERAEERLSARTPETDLARAETALHRASARLHISKK